MQTDDIYTHIYMLVTCVKWMDRVFEGFGYLPVYSVVVDWDSQQCFTCRVCT